MKKRTIEMSIFIPAVALCLIGSMMLLFCPDGSKKVINAAFTLLTHKFGWIYLVTAAAILFFSIWLAFSKYGNIKLGGENAKKNFTEFEWAAMMFTAGIGIGIVLLSFSEPIALLMNPPFPGIAPMSDQAYEYSHMYDQFLWGPIGWGIYVPATVAIAYNIYNRKGSTLRLSSSCGDMLSGKKGKFFGRILDVLGSVGTVGGVATSIGLGVPFVSAIIHHLFGFKEGIGLTVVILIIWIGMYGTSVFLGLEKGIKNLSSINMYIFAAFMVLVAIFSPLNDIINLETNTIGLMLEKFFYMAFATDPITKSGSFQDWIVFYWAWYFAFVPMMGLFVARTSKGRTIRELVWGIIGWGSGGCMVTFGLLGGYALMLQKNGVLDLASLYAAEGANNVVIAIIETLPAKKLVLMVYLVLVFIFMATTIDSTAYILASTCTKHLMGDEQPARWNRMLWAFILMVFSLGLIVIGGLQTAKTSAIVVGFPLTFVSILFMFVVKKQIDEDKKV